MKSKKSAIVSSIFSILALSPWVVPVITSGQDMIHCSVNAPIDGNCYSQYIIATGNGIEILPNIFRFPLSTGSFNEGGGTNFQVSLHNTTPLLLLLPYIALIFPSIISIISISRRLHWLANIPYYLGLFIGVLAPFNYIYTIVLVHMRWDVAQSTIKGAFFAHTLIFSLEDALQTFLLALPIIVMAIAGFWFLPRPSESI